MQKTEVVIKDDVNQNTLWIKFNDSKHITTEIKIKIKFINIEISIII